MPPFPSGDRSLGRDKRFRAAAFSIPRSNRLNLSLLRRAAKGLSFRLGEGPPAGRKQCAIICAHPVFAKQNSFLPRSLRVLRYRRFLFFPTVAFFFLFPRAQAGVLEDAAQALARKVATVTPRTAAVTFLWTNNAGLPDGQWEAFQQAFMDELEIRGTVTRTDPNVQVRVAFALTPAHFVFTASVPAADGERACIVTLSRSALAADSLRAASLILQQELIWRQPEPILGAAEKTSTSGQRDAMLVLKQDAITLYRFEKDQWILRDVRTLPGGEVRLRGARGGIIPEQHSDSVRVVLPGQVCETAFAEKSKLACRAENASPGEGVLLGSACDRRVWWLKSGAGDWTETDQLVLRNPSLEKASPSISELDVAGPVVSLSAEEGFRAAAAVVFNLSTGNYEVYRITLACGN